MAKSNESLHTAGNRPEHGSASAQSADAAPGVEATGSRESAFRFVQALAAELSKGHVALPAYPEVAMRVREAMGDEGVTNARIAQILRSDAGLTLRVLGLANSAALSAGGKTITDLSLAVTRIGHDHVRSAALAYALAQLRAAESLRHIREDLAELWRASTLVAAYARNFAIRTRAAAADEAMLAGLLHNIGCVYILSRAERHSALFTDRAARDGIMAQWHAHIGQAIADNWKLPEQVCEALGEQAATDRHKLGHADLADVLIVSVVAAAHHEQPASLELALGSTPVNQRLKLDDAAFRETAARVVEEIADLRAALGD